MRPATAISCVGSAGKIGNANWEAVCQKAVSRSDNTRGRIFFSEKAIPVFYYWRGSNREIPGICECWTRLLINEPSDVEARRNSISTLHKHIAGTSRCASEPSVSLFLFFFVPWFRARVSEKIIHIVNLAPCVCARTFFSLRHHSLFSSSNFWATF